MLDGVFDERLHDEWGHITNRAVLVDILHHMQPVTEAHLLHIEIISSQR
jgi:hypothetical protein